MHNCGKIKRLTVLIKPQFADRRYVITHSQVSIIRTQILNDKIARLWR